MIKRIDIPGATLNVADEGQGLAILFVHGFPLDHTMWRHQLADLARDYRCIAPDLRGFGKSTVTEGLVTMEQYADDLAALLDALGVSATEPVVLCGLSMGGYIAWQFWRRHAARLKALILCDTRAVADSPEAQANRSKLAEDVLRLGAEVAAKAMLPKLFAPKIAVQSSDVVDCLRATMLATDPRGIAAASLGMAQRVDATEWLPAIRCPALVLVGEHDVISTPAEMDKIASSIPQAAYKVIPNSGHAAPLENPDATNLAIRGFLNDLPMSVGLTARTTC